MMDLFHSPAPSEGDLIRRLAAEDARPAACSDWPSFIPEGDLAPTTFPLLQPSNLPPSLAWPQFLLPQDICTCSSLNLSVLPDEEPWFWARRTHVPSPRVLSA